MLQKFTICWHPRTDVCYLIHVGFFELSLESFGAKFRMLRFSKATTPTACTVFIQFQTNCLQSMTIGGIQAVTFLVMCQFKIFYGMLLALKKTPLQTHSHMRFFYGNVMWTTQRWFGWTPFWKTLPTILTLYTWPSNLHERKRQRSHLQSLMPRSRGTIQGSYLSQCIESPHTWTSTCNTAATNHYNINFGLSGPWSTVAKPSARTKLARTTRSTMSGKYSVCRDVPRKPGKQPPLPMLDQNALRQRSQEVLREVLPSLMWVSSVTDNMARLFCKAGVTIHIRPYTTIQPSVVRPKDRLQKCEQSGLVYHVSCTDCQATGLHRRDRAPTGYI